jgi:hypothetical protein
MHEYNKYMANLIVKSKWKLTSIEYSGLGDRPQVILANDLGDVKLIPLERGVTNIAKLVDLSTTEEE